MSDAADLNGVYERLGASIGEVGDRHVPMTFARPERAHQAIRGGVGVTEHPFGAITVDGDDRTSFLGDTITCRLPDEEGAVSYGFLLDPDGTIETDLYVADVGDSFLCLTAPGTAGWLARRFDERTFIQDVTVEDVTADHAFFGVHGPTMATKLRSVLRSGEPPSTVMTMTRGSLRDDGVTLVRLDAPIGEPGTLVLCRAEVAGHVFEALVSLGAVGVPFGYRTWVDLTLEAGTPLFESELEGRQPNVCGQLGDAVDLTKGCFVGQEVVARVANLGTIRARIVGLEPSVLPEAGDDVFVDDRRVGTITRAVESPHLAAPIALGFVRTEVDTGSTVEVGPDRTVASIVTLPFVDGTERSARIPRYESGA